MEKIFGIRKSHLSAIIPHCLHPDMEKIFGIRKSHLSAIIPHCLHPDMEKIFGIRKSHLSAIIQSFSEALYQISILYMTDPTIWHNRMPYYSQLISNKTRGIATSI